MTMGVPTYSIRQRVSGKTAPEDFVWGVWLGCASGFASGVCFIVPPCKDLKFWKGLPTWDIMRAKPVTHE